MKLTTSIETVLFLIRDKPCSHAVFPIFSTSSDIKSTITEYHCFHYLTGKDARLISFFSVSCAALSWAITAFVVCKSSDPSQCFLSLCLALSTVLRVRQGQRRRVLLSFFTSLICIFLCTQKRTRWSPIYAGCLASYPHIQVERCEKVILRYNMLPPFLWTCPSCIHSFLIACFPSCASKCSTLLVYVHTTYKKICAKKKSVLPRMKRRVHQPDQKSFYLEVSFGRHFVILLMSCVSLMFCFFHVVYLVTQKGNCQKSCIDLHKGECNEKLSQVGSLKKHKAY